MARLNVALPRALDQNANPSNGGKMFVYLAGTTTTVTTYSDAALTTAQAHPVVADSAGNFADVYVPDGNYKVVFKSSADVTLRATDNVKIYQTTVSDAVTAKTPAALKALTTIGYSGAGKRIVSEGDIVEAGGFQYEVAAEAATDAHWEIASGVKLYLLPGADGHVSSAAVDEDVAKFQTLIDNFAKVRFSPVVHTLTAGLTASATNIVIDAVGATWECNFSGTFFQNTGSLLTRRDYSLGLIKMNQATSKGIDFTNFSYCDFQKFTVNVREHTSECVWAKGNGLGTGPYYNNFEDFYAFGMNDDVAYPNQRGIVLKRATTGTLSGDGPNGNNFSDIKRLAGVHTLIDIESGNSNLFNNVQMESARVYGMRFNNHGGTEIKALGNRITNWRIEGSTDAIVCRFEDGARNNVVSHGYYTSVSSILWQNASDHSNFFMPKGLLAVVDFYGENLAASATLGLSPRRSGAFGGKGVPFDGWVHSVAVRPHGVPSTVAGQAEVKVYKSGLQMTHLPAMVVTSATYSDVRAIAPIYDGSDSAQQCLWASGHALAADVVSDAAWDGTAGDFSVQVIFCG